MKTWLCQTWLGKKWVKTWLCQTWLGKKGVKTWLCQTWLSKKWVKTWLCQTWLVVLQIWIWFSNTYGCQTYRIVAYNGNWLKTNNKVTCRSVSVVVSNTQLMVQVELICSQVSRVLRNWKYQTICTTLWLATLKVGHEMLFLSSLFYCRSVCY